jgi:hypothetical protein
MTGGGKRMGAGRKPGTPNKEKKPNSRGKVAHVRLSDAEYDLFLTAANGRRETISEFLRTAGNQRAAGRSNFADGMLTAAGIVEKHCPPVCNDDCHDASGCLAKAIRDKLYSR